MTAADALLVALGGAAGAPARMLVGHLVRARTGGSPAVGTLVVNVSGAFVLGLLVGGGAGRGWVALVGTGFCGAFTTFSSLALEVWEAGEERDRFGPLRIVGLALLLGLGAAALGWWLAGA